MTDIKDYTSEQIEAIVMEACGAAKQAATRFFREDLKGQDCWPCGFGWVSINGIRGNSRLGRTLESNGVRRNRYERNYQIWNPADLPVQNMDVIYTGAQAAAEVFRRYGFDAVARSRID
jgi:hypothetical protein